MIKHGSSHAAASLVCVLSAGLLGKLLADSLPEVKDAIESWAIPVFAAVGLDLKSAALLQLIPVLLIGFIWGVAFKLAQREEE